MLSSIHAAASSHGVKIDYLKRFKHNVGICQTCEEELFRWHHLVGNRGNRLLVEIPASVDFWIFPKSRLSAVNEI